MDVGAIFDVASKLTLTVALVGALAAFVAGVIESGRAVAARIAALMAERDKREAAVAAERDKREAMLIVERDGWKAATEAAQKQRDEADDRADRLASAFETAYRILVRGPDAGEEELPRHRRLGPPA